MTGRSCVVVLIGSQTADRKWVKYEIETAWKSGKGLLGVYVHNLMDQERKQSPKGVNPFYRVVVDGRRLSTVVATYDPPYQRSNTVYEYISKNLAPWVERAIDNR